MWEPRLLGAPKAKPFANQYMVQGRCQTCHVPPFEHQSQTNIMAVHVDCPHNIHHEPTRIMIEDVSIWPSTLER
jgi:hypothetical protein